MRIFSFFFCNNNKFMLIKPKNKILKILFTFISILVFSKKILKLTTSSFYFTTTNTNLNLIAIIGE